MATNGARSGPLAGDDAGAASHGSPRTRSIREILADLWHQKPGVRQERPGATERLLSEKQIVNGLSRNEIVTGAALAVLQLAVTISVYLYWHGSHETKYRHYAPDFLVAGLIGEGLLAAGLAIRRRALLGFAAFIVGMELISFGLIYGLLFLFYGGWLILRVMRKQRQDQARQKAEGSAEPRGGGSRTTSGSASGPQRPKPSKRYTPPKQLGAAARKR